MTTLEAVWRSGRIGTLELPHRIVMGSMHLGIESGEDRGAALAAFYRERAAGGAGLIITGGWAVNRVGAGGRGYGFINERHSASCLARVAGEAHDAGALLALQLFHAGRYARPGAFGLQPVAPSPVYSSFSRCMPRALSHKEIQATIVAFADGAARARELGFDAVEVMGSEGYLVNQFLSPITNVRDDQWGGDSERRMRCAREVVRAIRRAVGPDFPLIFRMSAADLVEGSTTRGETLRLARAMQAEGVDALNVGVGWHESRVPTVQALVPHGAWLGYAAMIRRAVSIPVIAGNRINTVELADRALSLGTADFIAMARPFLADPEIVRKSRGGRAEPVNVCIGCNQACIDRSLFDRRVSCVINPRAARELELPLVRRQAGARRRIAVVGGGPAGLQAARSLAARGAQVTLMEAGDRVGGQFRMASVIPGKKDFAHTIAYFEHELTQLGVRVETGARIDDACALAGFDGVVIATGVLPRRPTIPGHELPHVISYADLLLGDDDARAEVLGGCRSVAIVGGGGIGVDVAHALSAQGHVTVTIMRRGRRLGDGIGPSTRWAVLQVLRSAGVRSVLGVRRYECIEPSAVWVMDADGEPQRVVADAVVIAAGQVPNDRLAGALRRAGIDHVVIGGARSTAALDAERAFREGIELTRTLAP